jgi:hypothetical protein
MREGSEVRTSQKAKELKRKGKKIQWARKQYILASLGTGGGDLIGTRCQSLLPGVATYLEKNILFQTSWAFLLVRIHFHQLYVPTDPLASDFRHPEAAFKHYTTISLKT